MKSLETLGLLTSEQVAQRFPVKKESVKRWHKEGRLRAKYFNVTNKESFFLKRDVDAFYKEWKKKRVA
jgi:predicted site-specific integrase-resolvase